MAFSTALTIINKQKMKQSRVLVLQFDKDTNQNYNSVMNSIFRWAFWSVHPFDYANNNYSIQSHHNCMSDIITIQCTHINACPSAVYLLVHRSWMCYSMP
jgi:hypothetical protein